MTTGANQLDVLFLSQQPFWPLDHGGALRGYYLATALAEAGVRTGVAIMEPGAAAPPAELRALLVPWPEAVEADVAVLRRNWAGPGARWRAKLAARQGLEIERVAGAVALVRRHQPAAAIALGLHGPMFLRAVAARPGADGPGGALRAGVKTIWYAADELVRFDLTCLPCERPRLWPQRLRHVLLHAGLEALFARGLDGAIGVSPTETRWLQRVAGVRCALTLRNGVDLHHYCPTTDPVRPHSLAFWGRLDFEPNIDAVTWFARHVWPALRGRWPGAQWQIIGRNPAPAVVALADPARGLEVRTDLDDLRPAVRAAAAAILPMRCGGGIKNKLLEAAALGLPILASPRALEGLDFGATGAAGSGRGGLPLLVCHTPEEWQTGIRRVWSDAALASHLRRGARQWVERHHNWSLAARDLWAWIEALPERGRAVRRRRGEATTNAHPGPAPQAASAVHQPTPAAAGREAA